MQVTPRYEGPPVLEIDPCADVSEMLVRQRRRLGDLLAKLDDDQWAAATRCEGWSVQDVIAHLIGANQFWAISIIKGLEGEPTRFLAAFDPVATPAQMVEGLKTLSTSEVLDQFVATCDDLANAVSDLDSTAWSALAEAPIGHISVHAVALHALWDSWTHERDIALPLGLEHERRDDEVAGCLRYVAAIGPALRASTGSTRTGALAVAASDPDTAFVVHAGPTVRVTDGRPPEGAPRLEGDAVTLVEGLTFRVPLDHGLAPADAWMLGGLDAVFDRSPAA